MKRALLGLMFIGLNAQAMPMAGDWAKYSGKFTTTSQTLDLTMERDLKSYDEDTERFLEYTKMTVGGQVKETLNYYYAENYYTTDEVDAMVAKCSQYGGVYEKLTVKAGKFDTCRKDYISTGTKDRVWVGYAAFGEIKRIIQDLKNKTTTEFELVDYQFGF